ncbi:MAG: glycosyltransferase [Candidatus Yanofskybacteria bacterium]|nr:glycosyltransferase [Candidatus Yanofskybacteria bacterium]
MTEKQQKKRVFIVITQGETGGAQQFVAQLANHIDPERFTLHIVWGASGHSDLANSLPHHVTHATAKHLVRPLSPWHDFRAIGELRDLMRAFRPDIVLCISSKAGFVGSRAAHGLRGMFPNLSVIYRIGGWTFNDPWPSWKRTAYRLLEKISARWKDYIVLNNTHDLEQARQFGIRPRKTALRIYNGLDPYLPVEPRDRAREFLHSHIPSPLKGEPYDWLVGTVANLYPAKDIETLVRAAARVGGSVRFIVIGDGQQRAHLERLARDLGLHHRFFFVGRVHDARRYLQGFDVFVLPSVKEGFPWALLEAMAARVPVVATAVGAVPEMIEHDVSGIVCAPGNPEQIARGIVRLLGDDKLRQDLAIAAHQKVISTFSLREMISQYEKLFWATDQDVNSPSL